MFLKQHLDRNKRRGVALYLVAFVVAILSLGALALVVLVLAERSATRIRGNEIQVNQGCLSGVEIVRLVASMTGQERRQIGGIENNPRYFAGIVVMPGLETTNAGTLRTTILSPLIQNGAITGIRYGLVNESSRLNLTAVLEWELETPGQGRRSLMSLPGMTPSIADSILDWIDPDDITRPSGAELEYYQRIGVPYGPRNAVPVPLEELLLVRDVTRGQLFGNDATFSFGYAPNSSPNRSTSSSQPFVPFSPEFPAVPTAVIPTAVQATESNPFGDEGEVRIGETSGALSGAMPMVSSPLVPQNDALQNDTVWSSNQTGNSSNLPWCYLLTTLSAEKEVNPFGIAKFDLNEPNLEFLYKEITRAVDEETARFVISCRQNGPVVPIPPAGTDTPVPVASAQSAVDFSRPGSIQLVTPLDLLNTTVPGISTNPFPLSQAQGKERFLRLLDYGTTSKEVVVTGRVNINEAPLEVLKAIPGISNEVAIQIVSRRLALAANRANEMRHPVWLLTEGLIDLDTLKTLWNKITCGGDVYRCQVVGFFDQAGTNSRCEVVIDGTVTPPRQVIFKDLTMYGRGFPISVLSP